MFVAHILVRILCCFCINRCIALSTSVLLLPFKICMLFRSKRIKFPIVTGRYFSEPWKYSFPAATTLPIVNSTVFTPKACIFVLVCRHLLDSSYNSSMKQVAISLYPHASAAALISETLEEAYKETLKQWGSPRVNQLNRLCRLLGDFRFPVPLIQVLGLPGMGKTGLLRQYLSLARVAWAYVDCAATIFENNTCEIDVLNKQILKSLRDGVLQEWKHYCLDASIPRPAAIEVPNRIGSTQKFFQAFQKILQYSYPKMAEYSAVLVLDNAHELFENHLCFLQALLRHKEYLGNYELKESSTEVKRSICLILISKDSLPTDFLAGVLPPICLRFDAYDRESCKQILKQSYPTLAFLDKLDSSSGTVSPKCHYEADTEDRHILRTSQPVTTPQTPKRSPEHHSQVSPATSEEVSKSTLLNVGHSQLWEAFVNEFVNIGYHEFRGDFHEALFLCRHMWELSSHLPVAEGGFKDAIQTLKHDLGNHAKKALSNYGSHLASDLLDPVFLKDSKQSYQKSADVELSFVGRLLVVAAAIAFYTDHSMDSHLLNQIAERPNTKRRRRIASATSQAAKTFRHNPFTFGRWLSIADCLSHIVVGCSLEMNSLLNEQITSLLRLRLVSLSRSSERSTSVWRNATIQRGATYYSDLLYVDAFGEPYLASSNSSSTTQRKLNEPDSLHELLDPFTKLFCQVPLETVRDIAKKLPNVKLEEFIFI